MRATTNNCHRKGSGTCKAFDSWRLPLFRLMLVALMAVSPSFGQDQPPEWQTQVRKYAEAQDWDSAMSIVDREVAPAPQAADVQAWRARVLTRSGRLWEAG